MKLCEAIMCYEALFTVVSYLDKAISEKVQLQTKIIKYYGK